MSQFAIPIPSFNRRYVLLPMLLGIVLVLLAYAATEARREQIKAAAKAVLASQQRVRLLVELPYALVNAETAQRGYLLTGDTSYLQPYHAAQTSVSTLVAQLRAAYTDLPAEAPHIESIAGYAAQKMTEVEATVTAFMAGNRDSVLEYVNTNAGARLMDAVRAETDGLRMREDALVNRQLADWQHQHRIGAWLSTSTTALNVILLIVAGAFITRDIERRTGAANELDRLVARRTGELSALSNHMQRVTENERASLARELHDELGSLLIAMKIDLSQLERQLDLGSPEVHERWQRIQSALKAGVDLKRRVIEELRPTLLDNLGLVAALRWQAEQTCAQAGLKLQARWPDEEPQLPTDAAIAIFRVVQEALTNIIKHARAGSVALRLECTPELLTLSVEDDGQGLGAGPEAGSGAHGLASMRHRIQSLGGELRVESVQPHGTRIWLQVPRVAGAAPASGA